jgi:5-guanidino-2-oxopentanoate decarboxylase
MRSLVNSDESLPVQTTGEALVDLLEQSGVSHVFGIPGVHTIELYRGLANSRLDHVLAKHEQGAGFMADGFARASGKPAACFFITGPGITNALTAIGQAYSDSVPMLVFASTSAVSDLGRQRGRLHETKNQRAMLEPVTAFAATAFKPEDVPEYVNRAFAVFDTRRPRPVYIELPLDVLAQPARGNWSIRRMSARPGPRPIAVSHAAKLLSTAERPVIICGGGARGASREIRELAEFLMIPVFCTIAGKGIIPGDHQLSLDAVLHLDEARRFVSECDVVLAVGTELAQSELLTYDPLPVHGELIRVDIDHEQLCDEQRITLPILSDAELAVSAIFAEVRQTARARTGASTSVRVASMRSAVEGQLSPEEVVYASALKALHEAIPPETTIFTDMTTIAYAGNYLYRVPVEGRWIHPAGYGSLGYALPAAVGAALAQPDRPVVAIVGDGGFQFTMAEMSLIAERRLRVLVIIWNNSGFGQIKKGMVDHNVIPIGVDYLAPDFHQIAEAYGIAAFSPTSPIETIDTTKKLISGRRPAVIELTPPVFS